MVYQQCLKLEVSMSLRDCTKRLVANHTGSFTTCLPFSMPVRHHIPASSRHKCFVGGVRMMHRNLGGTPPTQHLYLEEAGMWCLTIT